MNRLELVKEIFQSTSKASKHISKYHSLPRAYEFGETLYMREAHFLDILGHYGTLDMSDLSIQLEITQGAVSQIAERLEKKDLIQRIKDPDDNRRVLNVLTDKGKKTYTNYMEYVENSYDMIADNLQEFTDEELKTYQKIMERFGEMYNQLLQSFDGNS